jgi:hypothetical protein
MRCNCIDASREKGGIPDVMAGAERRICEKKREADWNSGTTATSACERPASSRHRQPRSQMRSLTARAPAAQILESPSDTRVPPRSTSSAEASRSRRDPHRTETNRDQTKASRNKYGWRGRPRPASACASSQELAIARASSRACRVAPLGLREFSADPVQRSSVVERRGLTTPVADVAVDDQSLFQDLTCGWETTCRQPHSPEILKGRGPGRADGRSHG